MIYAPEQPTTQELYVDNPIDRVSHLKIAAARIAIDTAIANPDDEFLLVGPCPLTDDREMLAEEHADWNAYAENNGFVAAMRRHPFKPRSVKSWQEKMQKWHGLETGYPDGEGDPAEAARTAFEIMHYGATTYGNISMEMAFDSHVYRYGPLAAFTQIGARTRDEYYNNYGSYLRFLDFLARREPTLPIGIKNDADGSIDRALAEVGRVNDVRARLGLSAISRAVLIYRGGENVRTPKAWRNGAIEAIERTNGAVIIDTAHGGEQAFDPKGEYGKSEEGQLACLDARMDLRREGWLSSGVAIESSSIASPMDPHAPPEEVKTRLKDLHLARAA